MRADAGIEIPLLRVDGGGTANKFLMQFQADILGIPIQRAVIAETTALGAAYLAGLAVGMWRDTTEIARQWHAAEIYHPEMNTDRRETLYNEWKRAVKCARSWSSD
jgi:glycerol kinase